MSISAILVFLADFQDQPDFTFPFSCLYGRVGEEDGFVYKTPLSFRA